ncbi:cilia- and flagella-associated protein 157-like isoform X2 [Amphiprion ocellaris]|uniref:cilia- and flagella-associated protein 157-like isoform X2 n=1 Tax=Amphiprion ocellaris TaxID=80972 RepID=UPI000C3153ED|nr:cilia- and flagella-associated protein 157-like isoform X2 [Amphiprion ocellaris]
MIKSTVMADKNVCADKEKSLYLTQVRYLDEQLERLQLKCDELTKHNQKLLSQINALQEDKKDICDYLQHSSAAKDEKAAELAERLEVRLHNDKQKQEVLELQLNQQQQNLQEEVDLLQAECRKQEVSEQQLFQHLSELQSLRKQLDSQREEREAAKQNLCFAELMEKTNQVKECWINARDDLQRKMLAAAEEVKTPHTDLLQEVKVLQHKNQTLWMEKDSVERRTTELQCQIDGMKKNLRLVSNSVSNLQQEVEKWRKRWQQLRVKVKKSCSFHHSMLDQEQTLRQNLISVSENHHQKAAEMDKLKVQLKEEKICRRQLEEDVMEAVTILRHIVTDSETVPDAEQMLQKLKKIFQKTRSVVSDPTEEMSRGPKLQTAEAKPERDPVFLMARYRPGDFGFIPRPAWSLGETEDEHQRQTNQIQPAGRKIHYSFQNKD